MNGALPHPVRVLVKGSSLAVMVPDWNGTPGEYSFPRWIQNGLLDRGRPCELENRGVAGELTSAGLRGWESQVMATTPDVLVLAYGYYECIHGLLPHWLERRVNTLEWRSGPVRTGYRRWVLRPTWKLLAQVQRRLDPWISDRFFGRRVSRVVADYSLLIERTRRVAPGSPLVLVLGLLGPGGTAPEWFPGMQARINRMNTALAAMVDGFGSPGVRLVPVAELASRLDPGEDPVPDGFHYSPRMRRILGDWIAGEVDAAIPRIPEPGRG